MTTTHVRIEALARRDGRYKTDAYHFVFEALDFILGHADRRLAACGREAAPNQHVSVDQLLLGIRGYALDEFGPLARLVLERWGVYRTEDFGEIVFNLVESRLLNTQECDRKDDFRNGFNFREAFDKAWRPVPQSRA